MECWAAWLLFVQVRSVFLWSCFHPRGWIARRVAPFGARAVEGSGALFVPVAPHFRVQLSEPRGFARPKLQCLTRRQGQHLALCLIL